MGGQATWSDAFFDEGGANRPIITYSVPIRQDGVFIGVATMDVGLDPASTLGAIQAPTDKGGFPGCLQLRVPVSTLCPPPATSEYHGRVGD